jgi:acylphosphatase
MEEGFRGFRVYGKVQGVFYRHSTRIEAERLQLRGTARNLEDGSVEVVALGAQEALEAFRAWLAHGPVRARVDEIRDFDPAPALRSDLPEIFEVR